MRRGVKPIYEDGGSGEIVIPYNYTPRKYQIDLYNCIPNGYKRAVAIWHRRAGKDKTLINIIAREAVKRVGLYHYVFPFYAQGRKILWQGMDKDGFKFLDHIPGKIRARILNQEMFIELVNGSVIQVVGSDNIDTIVGTNPVGAVFSEYSLQDPKAWDFYRPIFRENEGWAIFNYTPRGYNHGYEMYHSALKNSEWFSQLLTVDDTGVLTAEDVESERQAGMPENMIRQEFYCSFEAEADNQLIKHELVQAAEKRKYEKQEYMLYPVVIGVDVAREGADKSVIAVRQGPVLHSLVKIKNPDTMFLVGEILRCQQRYKAHYVFIDSCGVGGPVVDRGNQLGNDWIGVNSGSSSVDKGKYFNKRAEMWISTRDWLETASIPNDDELRMDLMSQRYEFGVHNQWKMYSKEKMKKEGYSSPNCADALNLTFAYPIDPGLDFVEEEVFYGRDDGLHHTGIGSGQFIGGY